MDRAPHITFVLSLTGLFALWVFAAWLTDDAEVLASPFAVARIIGAEWASGDLWFHMSATLLRVAAAFIAAMTIGGALGLAMGLNQSADRWLSPWISVFLNMPALVVIVLCYLWIGLNEVAAVTAVAVNKAAMVAVTLREGVKARDAALGDLGRVYHLSWSTRFAHVIWPQLAPYVAVAARNGLAIIWKIVLVVEFLGRSNGVGFQIHLYFQLFETATVLAYAVSFVAVMMAIEYLVIAPWERHVTLWRRAAAGSA
ncbi:ABC transporter permease [Primorskyibacter sp. S187A]|uniref:ABC transporter permease n=1 Tax=Primorskyibacter sp. S187A TaxID=3415130 RepID=UPI003C7D503E